MADQAKRCSAAFGGVGSDHETPRHLPKSRYHRRHTVFGGTTVPVQSMLDYLEAGDSIDEFLAGFPSVTRDQVIQFLEAAKDRLIQSVA